MKTTAKTKNLMALGIPLASITMALAALVNWKGAPPPPPLPPPPTATHATCADALAIDTAIVYQVDLSRTNATINCEAYPLGTGSEAWLLLPVSRGHWRLKVKCATPIAATLLSTCDSVCMQLAMQPPGGVVDFKCYGVDTFLVMLSHPLATQADVEMGRFENGEPCKAPWYAGTRCVAKLSRDDRLIDEGLDESFELERKARTDTLFAPRP